MTRHQSHTDTLHILTADIGGTNSRFAHVCRHLSTGRLEMPRRLHLPTGSASSFAGLMTLVREQWGDLRQFACAALALPGAITHPSCCILPNVPWRNVDLDTVPDLPPRTLLLNDFEAQAWACLFPQGQDLLALSSTPPLSPLSSAQECREDAEKALSRPENAPALSALAFTPKRTLAVVGAGTGLGLSALLPGEPPRTLASEGGHAMFPFTPDEAKYAAFVQQRMGCTTLDVTVTGRGLSLLHAFHTGEELSPAQVAACMETTPVLEWFARFYGRICQTWVLMTMGLGGLYVTGGIAAANPGIVRHPAFWEALCASPGYEELLRDVPAFLVRNTNAALWGTALFAEATLKGV